MLFSGFHAIEQARWDEFSVMNSCFDAFAAEYNGSVFTLRRCEFNHDVLSLQQRSFCERAAKELGNLFCGRFPIEQTQQELDSKAVGIR